MDIKIIRTEADYDLAIKEIEKFINLDPDPGSGDAERLELLSLLLEKYEKEHFHFNLPDPIDAIKFVMEQRDLTRSDLIPFIGSRSKVSEVLSGKRPLSLRMMRKLHEGLNIPAEILLKKPGAKLPMETGIEWDKFPIGEMDKRGWIQKFNDISARSKDYAEELIQPILESLMKHCESPILPRAATGRIRGLQIDPYALTAWQARVVEIAIGNPLKVSYTEPIDEQFMRRLAFLSELSDGPLLARELLNKNGIQLIIVPHLRNTFLDGGIMLLKDGTPVIGLTLRYDRLDNFWFSLMHELAHLVKHLNGDKTPFFDDFDCKGSDIGDLEAEADTVASKALIPRDKWSKETSEDFNRSGSFKDLMQYAKKLNIHESILVGRIHYDTDNYRKFRRLLGNGTPSKLFGV